MPQAKKHPSGGGAAVTAIAAVGLPLAATMAKGEPGQLAELVQRYFAEVDASIRPATRPTRNSMPMPMLRTVSPCAR
jgi:hypothetical protein